MDCESGTGTTLSRLKATAPDYSAWVAANAGAGKTELLVSRVLRLLLAGTEASRILCITYTRAAAAEMRERILSRLSGWVVLETEALHDALSTLCGASPTEQMLSRARALFSHLADAPQGLRIDTIHAFCQSLLKCFPLEADIAPYFTVVDERTARELLHEAAMRLFMDSSGEGPLRNAVQALAARMSEMSFHELLLDIAHDRRRLRGLLAHGAEAAIWRMMRLLKLFPADTEESLLASLLPEVKERGEQLRQLLAFYLTKEGKPRTRGFPKDEKALAMQQRVHAFSLRLRALATARMSAHLVTVAAALLQRYNALKAARAALDYDDLIEKVTALLAAPGISPWVMYKLDGGIDHVLIDEAQDTSREQWQIAHALTEEFFAGEGRSEATRTLFAVGDEKQSIFRFQGAVPELFRDLRAEFALRVQQAGRQWAEVELQESFRSVAPVLQAVDAVFAPLGVQHGLSERKRGQGGLVEVWPLLAVEEEEQAWQLPESYVRRPDAANQLAAHVAATISNWLKCGEKLESTGRAITPGDIMILVRSRGPVAKAIIGALRRAGVPVAGADRLVLSESLAVQDLLALGAFLLLPEDNFSLACVLKSPLFTFSEEDLFRLAHGREGTLWERLPEGRARTLLADLLKRADYEPPYELFSRLLDAGDSRARFVARLGHAANDVLDEFLAQALAYEQAHTPTLQGFLHWMNTGEVEIRRDMEQAAGAVRIMTVHAAKGLQAPIVILPDTGPHRAPNNTLLWHEEALLWRPAERDASEEVAALKGLHAAQEEEEHQRLLYVAMTRAEDRLYVCGIAPKRGTGEGSWHDMVWSAMQPIAAGMDTPVGHGLRLASAQEKQVSAIVPASAAALPPMPVVLMRAAPPEKMQRPLSPSKLWQEPEDAPSAPALQEKLYRRGTLLHLLLQYLPGVSESGRKQAADQLLARHGVAQAERPALAREVLALLADPAFAAFFGPGSLAEVPLSGIVELNGTLLPISGQADRLAVTASEVWVLDYKTHAVVPPGVNAVSKRYIHQMAAYRALLSGIYPGRKVRPALLWTAGPSLMELPEAALDAAGMRAYTLSPTRGKERYVSATRE